MDLPLFLLPSPLPPQTPALYSTGTTWIPVGAGLGTVRPCPASLLPPGLPQLGGDKGGRGVGWEVVRQAGRKSRHFLRPPRTPEEEANAQLSLLPKD
jgi:hypothetical protein